MFLNSDNKYDSIFLFNANDYKNLEITYGN